MDIKMSLEDTKKLNGAICFQFIQQNQNEFDEQDYLEERYTRAKTLKQLMKIQDPTEMDIVIAYEKFLTDVAIGYGFGKAPTYYNTQAKRVDKKKTVFGVEKPIETYFDYEDDNIVKENDDFLAELQNLHRENRDHKEIIRFAKSCFIRRKAYELIYTNEDGDLRYKLVGGHGFLIKSDDIESKTIGFIRTYKTRKFNFLESYDTTSALYQDIQVIELYTHFKRVKYTSEDNYQTEYNLYENGAKPFEEDWEIPVVALEMPYDIGYFEQQIPEIRGLELVTNNTKKVLNYNDDAILLISGAQFLDGMNEDEVDKIISMYHTKGAIFTGNPDEGGDARWLIKDVNDQTNQAHKENLKNDIYGITGLFNPESDSAVYQNTLSLIFKLYGLETKMSEFEEIFKDAMRRRNKIIAQILNKRDKRNYDWKSIDMTMFRNLPSNTNEELNFVNQAREILPLEDLYEQLSFVTDAKEEVAKYERDQIRQAKLDAEIAKIMSEATMDDMNSDDPYNNNTVVNESNDDVDNDDDNNDNDNTNSIYDDVV